MLAVLKCVFRIDVKVTQTDQVPVGLLGDTKPTGQCFQNASTFFTAFICLSSLCMIIRAAQYNTFDMFERPIFLQYFDTSSIK